MKNYILSFVACSLLSLPVAASPAPSFRDFQRHVYDYIENLDVYELGQEPSRAYYIPEHHKLLNGRWQFLYANTPDEIPYGFYTPNAQSFKWSYINVPSNWEMEGWGDPMFRNVPVPFKANPPYIPHEYNPTGAYRTTFTIPSNWSGEEVFLRFEKVASASFLWINGQEVGYNEGAQEPSEYNITPYLKKGSNTLAMMVTKYSDGYYMEDQDYWRLAGIFDDVWLYATPKTRLFDWYVTTDLDAQYRDADLSIEATAVQYADANGASLKVKAQLLDKSGKEVASFESPSSSAWNEDKQLKLNLTQHITNPSKWTAETPDLYTLKMQLLDASGAIIDRAEQTIGFKETEIRDNVFYLNGQKIKVNAVNSHMQDPVTGHMVNEELIRKDMTILKQFGFNGVRTSHYPPVPSYLRLANEYGLYIIDEAGVEAHATEQICHDPRFTPMYRERVRRMVLRDRNQPCVLFWSAGNESGEGQNIAEVIDEGKKYDHTRWWMYGGNAYSHPAEDIIGPRYPTPLALDMKVGHHQDGDVRPSFMDEYISVAGNAGGNMDEMWRAVYQYDRTIGGALWDFVSPGLLEQERALTDASPLAIQAHLMGRSKLLAQQNNKTAKRQNNKKSNNHVLDINGHDQWVEIYRDPRLDLNGQGLTLSFDAMPRALNASSGTFVTKGSWQLGVKQEGNDKLRFYLTTDKAPESQGPRVRSHRYILDAPLPTDWYDNWHHIQASYDGKEMILQLDDQVVRMAAAGNIINAPYPFCIGRNAQTHNADTDEYLCDAQIDNFALFGESLPANEQTIDRALLWLDFEQETPGSNYFSYGSGARTYGTIWPDRTVQPEIYQMKKSTQPIVCSLINVETGTLEVWNRSPFLNANHYRNTWTLTEDGQTLLSGELNLDVAPLSRQLIQLPYVQNRPTIKPGREYRLMIQSELKNDELWAPAGHIVAWDQIELPWSLPALTNDATVGQAHLTQTDDSYIVNGEGFCYTFSSDGQLVGMELEGKQLLTSPLQINFWRAPIANEVDGWGSFNVRYTHREDWNGMQIANEWFSNHLNASTFMPISCEARELDGQVYLNVRCFTLYGKKAENKQLDTYISGTRYNGIEEVYEYRINGDGSIHLHHIIAPEGEQPALLPRIGLTLGLKEDMKQVEYYGRGPEENYPDRKTGYPIGIYQTTVDDMYEPYLIPQDHGLRCDNRYLTLCDAQGVGLRVSMDQPFNFNAYPFTTDQLTRATYQYQLHHESLVTLNLDYATTGVGCTCCYVLPSYRVHAERYERNIIISPIQQ